MKYEEAIQYIRKVSKMMKNIILNSSSQAQKKGCREEIPRLHKSM